MTRKRLWLLGVVACLPCCLPLGLLATPLIAGAAGSVAVGAWTGLSLALSGAAAAGGYWWWRRGQSCGCGGGCSGTACSIEQSPAA